MTDLQRLFGSYAICIRIAQGFLFVLALYFLLRYDIAYLESNSVIFITLSTVVGFISSILIKIVGQCIWRIFGNPTILYLKCYQIEIYKKLLDEHKNDEDIRIHILATIRGDSKLFWKNIAYAFFRNSILLSIVCLFFSCQTKYFYWNLGICLFVVFMTCVSSYYYAHQAIESYKEITPKDKANAE